MHRGTVVLIAALAVVSTAWAGGNGSSDKLIRLEPDHRVPKGTPVPVISVTGRNVSFPGHAGRIRLVGWDTGHGIVPTSASNLDFDELKFIIFPTPGLQPMQTRGHEPGMHFSQPRGAQCFSIELMLCGDKAMLWRAPLTLRFGAADIPIGPGNRPSTWWHLL